MGDTLTEFHTTEKIGPKQAFNANDPGASGYKYVLSETFQSLAKFDLNNTGASGFDWYMNRIWWGLPAPPSSVSLSAEGLILTDTIMTAGNASVFTPAVGRAWGGGFYVEAMLFWDQSAFVPGSFTPSFRGFSWEHFNQTDYIGVAEHFGELDFMETYSDGQYLHSVHDWYFTGGNPNVHFWNDPSVISAPVGGFHHYGVLWVPGTPGKLGTTQAYFDRKPVSGPGNPGGIKYRHGVASIVPPTEDTKFSILDTQHFVIVLRGSPTTPLTVRSVQVWQLPTGTMVRN